MIDIINVCKNYGDKQIIDNISLRVESGQTLVLLGTSGSGKTTLLKMINFLVTPTTGTILVDGQNITEVDKVQLRRSIGYVIQQVGLLPHYTNRANIELTLKLNQWSESQSQARSRELLALVGLEEADGDRYPEELSGGQQQRVGIARAVANDPAIILMDEPFGALDPITKQNLILELKEKQLFVDKTVVMVTHDVFEAITLADKICLLDKGTVQQIGTPKEMLFRPTSQFVKEFFNAQRLRLEMQVVLLSEVYDLLSSTSGNRESLVRIPLEKSIWEASEIIEQEEQSAVVVGNSEKSLKVITPLTLMEAFYQFKERKITHSAG